MIIELQTKKSKIPQGPVESQAKRSSSAFSLAKMRNRRNSGYKLKDRVELLLLMKLALPFLEKVCLLKLSTKRFILKGLRPILCTVRVHRHSRWDRLRLAKMMKFSRKKVHVLIRKNKRATTAQSQDQSKMLRIRIQIVWFNLYSWTVSINQIQHIILLETHPYQRKSWEKKWKQRAEPLHQSMKMN